MPKYYKFKAIENDEIVADGIFDDKPLMMSEISEFMCDILRFKKITDEKNNEVIIEKNLEEVNKFFNKREELNFGGMIFNLERINDEIDNELKIYKEFKEEEKVIKKSKIRLINTNPRIKLLELDYKSGPIII